MPELLLGHSLATIHKGESLRRDGFRNSFFTGIVRIWLIEELRKGSGWPRTL
ncbi:MAG: hypothetical protein CM15mP130_0320 [Verrucomicrobiota bacterium]|nr:MAG: hypothetical protein CM15mP130_0320 [Verrucomicrobiota bacterium]